VLFLGKIEEKKLDKFRRILDSAYALSEHKDVHFVSIDEIVKNAGVSKGTFYLYFKDKYDLISKIIIDKISAFMSENDAEGLWLDSSSDYGESIDSLVKGISEFLKKNMTLTKLIDKNVHICVNAVIENLSGSPKKLYDATLEALVTSGLSKAEAENKLYIFFDMTVSCCCNALIRGKPLGIDEVCRNLTDIFTCYVAGVSLSDRGAKA
jgi:AcrR family transcriptional regulator